MPRKGYHKVQSGCLTCKARKVKCDETKPQCNRCTLAGRICQGLAFGQRGLSQLGLYRPQNHILGNIERDEPRVIEFFCRVVAPSLSGPIDPYFWTHIVIQFSEYEPTVSHCIMTISSLFENLRPRYTSSPGSRIQGNIFAIKHYNTAIRELQKSHGSDLVLVLMTCIMFICIEILQSNAKVAFQHLSHGINLLNTSHPSGWISHHLLPIFRRLSILPFYFGDSQLLYNWSISTQPRLTISPSFYSLFEAQASMDAIYGLTVQFFRCTSDYRIGQLRNQPVSSGELSAQREIRQYLAQWRSAFDELELQTSADTREKSMSRIWLFQQYEACTILSQVPYTTNETDYDLYISSFKRMVRSASTYAGLRLRLTASTFHFEMGFAPILFFVAIKCRCLKTRIEALGLLGVIGALQESLWDSRTLQVIAQRIIDLEHGIAAQTTQGFSMEHNSLPPDEIRVRHFALEPLKQESIEGHVAQRMIKFYVLSKSGDICMKNEILKTKQSNESANGTLGIFEADL